MEIIDKPKELGNTNTAFKITMQILICIALLLYSYGEYDKEHIISHFISRIILSLFISIILIHYAWIISDIIRKWIMPEVLVTSGAIDALQKKIFWLYGPQFTTSWMSAFVFYFIGNVFILSYWKEPAKTFEPNQTPNSTITLPAEQPNTTVKSIDNSVNQKNDIAPTTLSNEQQSPANNQPLDSNQKQPEVRLSIEELEKKANYSGDDPVIRKRLGLPPKN